MSTVVIFHSLDRPLRLDAALRSFLKHCTDPDSRIKVLYRTTTSRQASLYRQLARDHPEADFIPQHYPEADPQLRVPSNFGFFEHLNNLLPDGPVLLEGYDYAFVVSEFTIFNRDFSMAFLTDCLRRHADAIAFTFSLSHETDRGRKRQWHSRAAPFHLIDTGVIKFKWANAKRPFPGPTRHLSAIYRTRDLICSWSSERSPGKTTCSVGQEWEQSRACLLCPDAPLILDGAASAVSRACADYIDQGAAAFAAGGRIDLSKLPRRHGPEVDLPDFTIPSGEAVPLVSVVIPCHDQAQYLGEAVSSVIAQSFTDWELIIVNDGSPDDTSSVAHRLIREHSGRRIRLIEQKNGGLSHARNTGIRSARGAYVLPVDADDWISTNTLELMVPALQQDPSIGIVYCDLRHFGGVEKIVRAPEYDFRAVCERNGLNYCSLFRREVWEAVGGYNRNMIWSYEDRDFWIGCGEKGFFGKRIPEVLLNYRVKQESMYTKAVRHDRENRARIVLNHPSLFSQARVAEARAIWGNQSLGLPLMAPRISVIVTTCNRPDDLEIALRSIGQQRFKDFEIVLVNDGGIDVQHIAEHHCRGCALTHVRHHSRRGLAAARNTGFRLASGKYVAWLDDGDPFAPDHLENIVDLLEHTGCTVSWAQPHHPGAQIPNRVTGSQCWHDCRRNGDDLASPEHGPPFHSLVYARAIGIAVGELEEAPDANVFEAESDYWVRLASFCRQRKTLNKGLVVEGAWHQEGHIQFGAGEALQVLSMGTPTEELL
jgi:glycosyltransferase involved in cell wall biosynthesis